MYHFLFHLYKKLPAVNLQKSFFLIFILNESNISFKLNIETSEDLFFLLLLSVAGVRGLLLMVYLCSRLLILLSDVCGHTSALSCKKVSEAYIVISCVNLLC